MKTQFLVTWSLDVVADDEVSAAREAQRIMIATPAGPWTYSVRGDDDEAIEIDLAEDGTEL